MLMGSFLAASKPLFLSLLPFLPTLRLAPRLLYFFVLTFQHLLSLHEHSIPLLLLSCDVPFHLSASVYFSPLPLPPLALCFFLSSLMNGVAGL